MALAKMRIVKMFTQTLDMEVRKRDKETVFVSVSGTGLVKGSEKHFTVDFQGSLMFSSCM